MPRPKRLSFEHVSRRLREWDPVAGDDQLTTDERREIERRLVMPAHPAPSFRTRRPWSPLALATAGGLVVVLMLLVGWSWGEMQNAPGRDHLASGTGARPTLLEPDGARPGGAPHPPRRSTQVQLIAKGGTRIVWVLNPELPDLPDGLKEN
jgi:hypothetical protein